MYLTIIYERMPSMNYLKETRNSSCYVTPPKLDASWAYTKLLPNNSKYADHRHVSFTGTGHYNCKLSKKYWKIHSLTFYQYFGKSARKSQCKGW